MKTFVRFGRLAPVILALAVFVLPLTAGEDRPWMGTVSGDESSAPLTGHASHLGAFKLVGTGVVFIGVIDGYGVFAGPAILTAANGDEVDINIVFRFPEGATVNIPFTGEIAVDGGTGRFAGATGSADFAGVQDYPGGPFWFSLEGTISY